MKPKGKYCYSKEVGECREMGILHGSVICSKYIKHDFDNLEMSHSIVFRKMHYVVYLKCERCSRGFK